MKSKSQCLVSLPGPIAAAFSELGPARLQDCFVTSDPDGKPLGSGGGTAWLLAEAWRQSGGDQSFSDWLRAEPKLLIHSGGQSRRLPAYAATGKALIPIPVFRWALGQRLDQTLIDLQLPGYRRILAAAPDDYVAMLASGDVLLRFARELPVLPAVDALCLGLWVAPDQAQNFGVCFCPRDEPSRLDFFLQKPPAEKVRELAKDYLFLVDTGLWLFSERAVGVLLDKCGWQPATQDFAGGTPAEYEFYAGFCLGLGRQPQLEDPAVNGLSAAVVPLPEGEFYHFGTSRDLISSVTKLQRRVLDQSKLGHTALEARLNQHTQNAQVQAGIPPESQPLWIENAHLPARWKLAKEHVLTGIPENDWALELEPGVCIELAPIGKKDYCLRVYGIDDPFRGAIGEAETVFLGRPLAAWLAARGIEASALGKPELDIQQATLFPVLPAPELEPGFVKWLFARKPEATDSWKEQWLQARRLSARELGEEVHLERLFRQRFENQQAVVEPMMRNRNSVFYKLDLKAAAELYRGELPPETEWLPPEMVKRDFPSTMLLVHEQMFRAQVLKNRGKETPETLWQEHESRAFAILSQAISSEAGTAPPPPRCALLPDQILWGRSPVRLDLAGGWTDTPPYCLQHGGRVFNLAVNLNGQPPIQVFARRNDKAEIILRSIDLGVEERVESFDQLLTYTQVGGAFSIPKAALWLGGFRPQPGKTAGPDLKQQLEAFGGGIELSLLAAVPKGSGLGTSSILAATVLGTLSELCGLNWDEFEIIKRTLALEQMLTTGGGWQDQAGGILRGIKLIETQPGLEQRPLVHYVHEHMFGPEYANHTVLLYYTGLTRVAKGILQEIVRGMFLNSATHLAVLEDIGANATTAYEALLRNDWPGLWQAVRTSWELNQRLDRGTNPPGVQTIVDRIADYTAGLKLLGAGGGGYMLIFARDAGAGERIRQILTKDPTAETARFVELEVSQTGLEITRS